MQLLSHQDLSPHTSTAQKIELTCETQKTLYAETLLVCCISSPLIILFIFNPQINNSILNKLYSFQHIAIQGFPALHSEH